MLILLVQSKCYIFARKLAVKGKGDVRGPVNNNQITELVTEGAVALSASNQQSFGPEWIPVCVCMPLNAGVSIIFRSREKRTLPSLLYINY